MATGTMSSRNSLWMLAIRGIIALLFGLAVFIRPNMFNNSFAFLFGIYALVDGVVAAGMALDDRAGNSRWYIVFLEGLVGIVFGLLAMFSTMSLLNVITFWALIMGILELASVFATQGSFSHDWTMVIGGIASVVLAIVLFFTGASSMLMLVGIFAIVFGVMMFARFVQFKSTMDTTSTATA
ncbi:MAG TPA: DUF308 domain-containing protein [Ktedonobacteraceae bacterium]|jgi:uncharacterized membrane protein HdeD (DUF308 family)|nr:DUF308 domain-containing protein [Ktedonobacteraceae bacterium]